MKIFKYTAFDVTKERISMRIESRYRPKFKSIYDGIFNKVGKSVGAAYGILVTSLVSDIDFRGFSPFTSTAMAAVIGIWIFWVVYLGRSFNTSLKTNEPIDIDITEEANSEKQELKKAL